MLTNYVSRMRRGKSRVIIATSLCLIPRHIQSGWLRGVRGERRAGRCNWTRRDVEDDGSFGDGRVNWYIQYMVVLMVINTLQILDYNLHLMS